MPENTSKTLISVVTISKLFFSTSSTASFFFLKKSIITSESRQIIFLQPLKKLLRSPFIQILDMFLHSLCFLIRHILPSPRKSHNILFLHNHSSDYIRKALLLAFSSSKHLICIFHYSQGFCCHKRTCTRTCIYRFGFIKI